MQKLRYVAVIAILAALGCSQDSGKSPAAVEADLWEGELPIRQPWLRDQLSDQALIYVRIPNLLGLFAMPKGNVMDPALRSTANVENLEKIRRGLADNVVPLLDDMLDSELRVLLQHVRSPVEIAGSFLPAPTGLIAVTLDIGSDADLALKLAELDIPLAAPLDARGVAQIDINGMTAFLRFDAATGRFLMQVGPGANEGSFEKVLAAPDRTEPHAMRSLESRIDESGQGLFLWINASEAIPLMQMIVPAEQLQEFVELGLDKVSALAMGWGVANGKGRIAIAADLPSGDGRGLVPRISTDVGARSVGEPDGLLQISLPTVEEFSRLEALTLQTMSADDATSWREGKAQIKERMGVTIEELWGAIGPELLLIFDRAGDYAALRIRDVEIWNQVVAQAAEFAGSAPEQKTINGITYYHWSLEEQDLPTDLDLDVFGVLFSRQRDHVYWMQDGEFIYIATVPQILYDRSAMNPDTHIGDWLKNVQRIDSHSAAVSVSGTSRKIPARLYAFYVELLQLLADLAEADIDIWSMPSAAQLGLPEKGTMGFALSLGDPTVAAEFTFENNPGEMFGSLGTVAAVGVVAAVAIPAYQDYTTRAQISEGLNLSSTAKAAVSEFYATNGRFPGASDAAKMSIPNNAGTYVWWVDVEADTGRIVIEYRETVAGTGGQLVLEPRVESAGDVPTWQCSGTFQNKHLPSACRY